jgi:ABC-type sugar transport system ATPase subunit
MISLDKVSIGIGKFQLRQISFTIPAGAYGVLMGTTGSGKTSLLEAICGLRKISGGSIHVSGEDVTRKRPGNRGIGYVPQDGALFPNMTVRDHLNFAHRLRHWPAEQSADRVRALAEQLELSGLLERLPAGLSGGERQRVALGRAISFEPAALCLDEPLSALDEAAQDRMRTLLAEMHGRSRMTVLHVTHSRREAEQLGTCRLHLDQGRVELQP